MQVNLLTHLHVSQNHLRGDCGADNAVVVLPLCTFGRRVFVFINVELTTVVRTVLFQRYRLVD